MRAHTPRQLAREGRRAAVAAILRDAGDSAEILLIRRSESPDDPWSGHMALPGGRHEPSDPSLLETARRETLEELGLDLLEAAEPIGALDELEAIARGRRVGMVISPFVFRLRSAAALRPNHEVAEALWAPLGAMASGALDATRPYVHEGQRLELPAFDIRGRIVWGLTHQMLSNLFYILER